MSDAKIYKIVAVNKHYDVAITIVDAIANISLKANNVIL
jgi:hypothetical protein